VVCSRYEEAKTPNAVSGYCRMIRCTSGTNVGCGPWSFSQPQWLHPGSRIGMRGDSVRMAYRVGMLERL
jgi:hypothetical protein